MTIVLGKQSFDAERQGLHKWCLHHRLMIAGHEDRLHGMSGNRAPSQVRRVNGVLIGMEYDKGHIDRPNPPLHHPAVIVLGSNERGACPCERIIDGGLLPCTEGHCNTTQNFFDFMRCRSRCRRSGCTKLLRE